MLTLERRASALAAAVCLALVAGAPLAANPPEAPAEAESEKDAKPTTEARPAEAEEEKRICRYIRADAASRRKTKVCRTVDEWRELNNIR